MLLLDKSTPPVSPLTLSRTLTLAGLPTMLKDPVAMIMDSPDTWEGEEAKVRTSPWEWTGLRNHLSQLDRDVA